MARNRLQTSLQMSSSVAVRPLRVHFIHSLTIIFASCQSQAPVSPNRDRGIMLAFTVLLAATLLRVSFVSAGIGGSVNLTDFVRHRQKRFLIYENGGILRLNAGPVLPIIFGDPIDWRSFVITYNIQGGFYDLPSTPVYPWDKWENIFARSMRNMNDYFESHGKYREDDSRLFVYVLLESYMNRQHGKGRACLLRAICENAQVDQHVGVFAEVLNIVLTPGKEALHPIYKQAHLAGKSSADCLQLYSECPRGASLLDQYFAEY